MPLISPSRCLLASWILPRSAASISRLIGDRALLQHLAVERDGVERRAQLVAHVGDELALRARRRLGLLLAQTEPGHQLLLLAWHARACALFT